MGGIPAHAAIAHPPTTHSLNSEIYADPSPTHNCLLFPYSVPYSYLIPLFSLSFSAVFIVPSPSPTHNSRFEPLE